MADPLPPAEVDRVLATLSQVAEEAPTHFVPRRDEALFKMAFTLGLRATELTMLKVGDVAFKPAFVQVDCQRIKCAQPRRDLITLPDDAGRALFLYAGVLKERGLDGSDAPLFPSRSGTRMDRSSVWKRWKLALKGAGIDPARYPLHSTRATVASELYAASGGQLFQLQRFLGHRVGVRNGATTLVYVDPSLLDGDGAPGWTDKTLISTAELARLRRAEAQLEEAEAALMRVERTVLQELSTLRARCESEEGEEVQGE